MAAHRLERTPSERPPPNCRALSSVPSMAITPSGQRNGVYEGMALGLIMCDRSPNRLVKCPTTRADSPIDPRAR